MKKIIKMFFLIIILVAVALCLYFCFGSAPRQKNITWGVNFSQMQAENLKLDWKKTYLAILEDLGAKHIKLLPQWDWVEGKKDDFFFSDTDWQVAQAESHDASLIYVLGMKTGRWPECHVPTWAEGLLESQQQDAVLAYIREVVLRYKDSKAVAVWQVENEPLFKFGKCPSWYYANDSFLKKEVALVKSLDPSRQVLVSDSGELSSWFDAASIADKVGVTMYRKAWVNVSSFGFPVANPGFYGTYPIPPLLYTLKAKLVNFFYHKQVIGVELQAEPWTYKPFYNIPLVEQEKTMNLQQFKNNVEYAQRTGFGESYFWGAEWWYWLKEKQDKPEIWNEAKSIFQK